MDEKPYKSPESVGEDSCPDPEQLAKYHAHLRRVYDRLWLAVFIVLVVGGVAAWAITRDIEQLYGFLFLAVFPLIGLVYNHCFLFNPWRDPLKTQQRLENLAARQQKNTHTVARTNGRILLYVLTPIILLGPFLDPNGFRWWYLLIAVPMAIGNVCFCLWMIRWGRQPPRCK